MLKTILKRILQSIPTLLIVITITFVLTRMIPGNPARTILGPQASAQDIAEMEIKLGLNKSKLEQYADYMIGILHGDFGTSYAVSYTHLDLNGKYISLDEYLEAAKDKHENQVFYVTDELQQSQYINMFKEQGLNAVILKNPIDQPFISRLEEAMKDKNCLLYTSRCV